MGTGRYAPSPTGSLHLGNLRTALLAWLFARSAGHSFVLRIDDLDPADARAEHAENQLADLQAIGLDWDGEVMWQSNRQAAYDEALAAIEAQGLTYRCWCTRAEIRAAVTAAHGPTRPYPGTCRRLTTQEQAARERSGRPAARRLRADNVAVSVVDRLHGPITMEVDDFVLQRNDGLAAYNLAVVLDDAAQGVTEVVRGDDLLDSTPRQVLLGQLLGLPTPSYAHVPLVLGSDGARLAKRHGSVTLADLQHHGQSVAQVRSLLAVSLGLATPGELVSPDVLVDRFDPDILPSEPWVWSTSLKMSIRCNE